MAEKITVAKLDLDVKGMIASMKEAVGTINKLNTAQKDLLKEQLKQSEKTDEDKAKLKEISTQYNSNATTIKQLWTDYDNLTKAVQRQITANQNLLTTEETIKLAIDAELYSVQAATENNKQLLSMRNQLNPAIEEEAALLQEVNQKLQSNQFYINQNASVYEKQIITITAYRDSMKEAVGNINNLNAAQKDLLKEQKKQSEKTDEGKAKLKEISTQYNNNAATIKQLWTDYDNLTKAVQQQITANKNLLTLEEKVKLALDAELYSLQAATENNKQLLAIRNQLNPSLKDEAALLQEVNQKLQSNQSYINQNASVYEKQIITITAYRDSIKQALADINIFNGGLMGFISRAKEAGGTGALLKTSFKAISQGIGGMTKAAWEFAKTPLGAIIALIAAAAALVVGAFKLMTSSMNRTEEGSAKLATAMATVKAIFNAFWKIIEPLGEWLGEVFTATVKFLEEALYSLMETIADALEFLHFDEAAASLRQVRTEVQENIKAIRELAEAEAELEVEQRKSLKTQYDHQKQAEKLRKLRDDENKSINERIKLNKKLGVVVQAQLNDELSLAQKQLNVLDKTIKAKGKNADLLREKAEAELRVAKITDNIAKQQEDHIANLNSLRKQAHDEEMARQQKRFDDAITKLNLEMEAYNQLYENKLLTLNQELQKNNDNFLFRANIAKKERDAANQAAKKEFEDTKDYAAYKRQIDINDFEYNNKLNQAKIDAHKAGVDSIMADADKQLAHQLAINQTQLRSDKFLTEEAVANEKDRLDRVTKAQLDTLTLSYHNKLITEQEYLDQANVLHKQNDEQKLALDKQRRDAEATRRLTDISNRLANDAVQFDEKIALEKERLDIEMQQELASAELTGAEKKLIIEKNASDKKKLDKEALYNELDLRAQAFDNFASIMGEQTEAAKGFAIASSIINTYKAADVALGAYPPPFSYIAAAATIVKGLRNVAKIKNTKTSKFEKGGLQMIGGNRHSAGGTKFMGEDGTRFEAEQGELIGVMNRTAAQHFLNFNNAFSGGTAVKPSSFLATGGIVSRTQAAQQVDYDVLAGKIAIAASNIPAPVIGIKQVLSEADKQVAVVNSANYG